MEGNTVLYAHNCKGNAKQDKSHSCLSSQSACKESSFPFSGKKSFTHKVRFSKSVLMVITYLVLPPQDEKLKKFGFSVFAWVVPEVSNSLLDMRR